ncbi:hypothetical protein F4703DRAFT_1918904 [Phycomyces blakesleeanus]
MQPCNHASVRSFVRSFVCALVCVCVTADVYENEPLYCSIWLFGYLAIWLLQMLCILRFTETSKIQVRSSAVVQKRKYTCAGYIKSKKQDRQLYRNNKQEVFFFRFRFRFRFRFNSGQSRVVQEYKSWRIRLIKKWIN